MLSIISAFILMTTLWCRYDWHYFKDEDTEANEVNQLDQGHIEGNSELGSVWLFIILYNTIRNLKAGTMTYKNISIHLSICPHASILLFVHASILPSILLSICLSIGPSCYLSSYSLLSATSHPPFIHPAIYPSCLPLFLSYLSIQFSILSPIYLSRHIY